MDIPSRDILKEATTTESTDGREGTCLTLCVDQIKKERMCHSCNRIQDAGSMRQWH
jgi:hypothetical protein